LIALAITASCRTAEEATMTDQRFRVRLETTKGDVAIEVDPELAPQGSQRLREIVEASVLDGARFFRVVPGFVVQFGIAADPTVAATWRNRPIRDDPVKASNIRGTVTFATAGPNTRTTQLFVNLRDNERLDSMGFAPIGRVVEGMDVVDRLYSGYGEGAPQGKGPRQDRIQSEGEAYLARDFPELDRIERATIAEGGAPAAQP
jgi:peptidyl-prolyl cis-trans isomerase A (cyclophilin A)